MMVMKDKDFQVVVSAKLKDSLIEIGQYSDWISNLGIDYKGQNYGNDSKNRERIWKSFRGKNQQNVVAKSLLPDQFFIFFWY